jgi:PAS domain S-box-containing protein
MVALQWRRLHLPSSVANSPQTHPVGATGIGTCSTAEAVFILDGTGKILLTDAGARSLWQSGDTELNGARFPSLFAFDVTPTDPGKLDSQWEALLAAASSPLSLAAQLKSGTRLDVSVRLEKTAFAAAPAYIAFVQPVSPGASGDSLLTMLADHSPLGIFDLNFKAGTFFYSTAWKSQLGYGEQELSATFDTWRSLLHPEDSAAAPDQAARKSSCSTRAFSTEYRLRHKKGHYVWLHGIGLQVLDPNGKIERVVGAHIDISERKEFEDAAIESEERFEELSGPGPLGVFDLNFAAERYWFSPAWKRLLGQGAEMQANSPDALAGALHPDDAPEGLKEFFLSRNPGQPSYVELRRLRHKDGHYLWVLAGALRHVSRKRELLRVTGFHLALPPELPVVGQQALPVALIAAAFTELHEGVILANAAGRALWANDKAAQLLSQAPNELRDRPILELLPLVHRTSGKPAEFPVNRLFELGESVPLNNDCALSHGEGVTATPIVFSARHVADPAGRTIGAVIVLRNPEEMTLSPEELIKANRFESLGVLAGGIAHDFNNLLTTILGGISLAKDNRDYSRLEDSEKSCLAAKGLTKQLLTFAKGGTTVQTVLAPITVLKDAVRVASAGSSTKVTVEVAPATGNVLGDRAQLLQVFQNLVVNAIQAMPEGRASNIWLRATDTTLAEGQVSALPAGDYVQFEVKDDGCGIPPENIAKIFAAFFTTKKHGTGLGLATVLDVVRKHGGQIGVDSTIGKGTTFTVFLPRAGQPVAVEARRAPTLRFGTGRILFMDDDEDICEITAGMLDSLEYKYDVAKKGEEAIALYKRFLNIGKPYDVVIMDLTIVGGMGGEEAFMQMRELDPEIRAIVSSGYDNEEMARKYLDMGFCGYLTKPYRVTELSRILKTVLG